ncbi:MAG: hypothetical protein MUC66_01185 [Methanolinea sp.]|jgi:hypothetical protein|nr:hypothetical protein [Methanolinea sp.]
MCVSPYKNIASGDEMGKEKNPRAREVFLICCRRDMMRPCWMRVRTRIGAYDL